MGLVLNGGLLQLAATCTVIRSGLALLFDPMAQASETPITNAELVNWRPSSIPTRLIPTAVSCTSSTHCVAVGGNLPKAKSAVIMTYS